MRWGIQPPIRGQRWGAGSSAPIPCRSWWLGSPERMVPVPCPAVIARFVRGAGRLLSFSAGIHMPRRWPCPQRSLPYPASIDVSEQISSLLGKDERSTGLGPRACSIDCPHGGTGMGRDPLCDLRAWAPFPGSLPSSLGCGSGVCPRCELRCGVLIWKPALPQPCPSCKHLQEGSCFSELTPDAGYPQLHQDPRHLMSLLSGWEELAAQSRARVSPSLASPSWGALRWHRLYAAAAFPPLPLGCCSTPPPHLVFSPPGTRRAFIFPG